MSDDVTDVDQILADVGSTDNTEIPMTAEPPQQPSEPEYEYTARGKTIKEPISAILKRASQGYDYSQVMADLNKQKQEIGEKYKLYSEVDKYASTNPDWWNHVNSQFQQISAQGSEQPLASEEPKDLSPELQPILSEINELKSFKNEFMAEKQRQFREQEDAKLKEEIEGIRKTYPNIDFDSPQEDGKSLELKVLEHGVNNGIRSFKTAFRDFHHEELVRRAKEEGMEATKKELQKNSKLGLLGQTSTPTKGIKQATDLNNQSYNDLLKEAYDELGITNNQMRR